MHRGEICSTGCARSVQKQMLQTSACCPAFQTVACNECSKRHCNFASWFQQTAQGSLVQPLHDQPTHPAAMSHVHATGSLCGHVPTHCSGHVRSWHRRVSSAPLQTRPRADRRQGLQATLMQALNGQPAHPCRSSP